MFTELLVSNWFLSEKLIDVNVKYWKVISKKINA